MHDRDLSYRQIGRQMIGRQIYRQIKINRQNCCLFVYGVLKMSSRTNWRKTEVTKKKKKNPKVLEKLKGRNYVHVSQQSKTRGTRSPRFFSVFSMHKVVMHLAQYYAQAVFFLSQITKRTFDQLIKEDVFTHYITTINTEGS